MRKVLTLLFLLFVLAQVVSRVTVDASGVASPMATVLREGNDFATRVLGDPWDMNEFTDVSMAMNNAGRSPYLANWSVNSGIFTAQSTSLNFAQFHVLYPGFIFTMHNGKVGERFPIASAAYHCVFTRMKVNSPVGDRYYVFWSDVSQYVIGQTAGIDLHNDGLPAGSWRIYKVDLASPPNGIFYNAWSSRATWAGLRINPTNTPNSSFSVDWVRLTDCNPVNYSFNWTPVSGQTQLWAGIGRQQKDIFIGSISGSASAYTWDVQGIAPGTYNLGVQSSNGSMVWTANQLTILPTPILHFQRPSATSGQDYATAAGSPWNFSSSSSVKSSECVERSVASRLVMDTPYPALLPSNCKGDIGEADPKVMLNTPATLSGSSYRYLSFNHYINGASHTPADGMIGRIIWFMNGCAEVSQGIPLEVGWHQYTVDLFDPSQGMPEGSAGCGQVHWLNSTNITGLRFDPNENWTGNLVPAMSFHQEITWIRLTKEDQVKRGAVYSVQTYLDVPPSQVRSLAYYYTTDRNSPTQNVAAAYVAPPVSPNLTRKLFLPTISLGDVSVAAFPNQSYFAWNTTNVAAGKYYICAVANDGYNMATYCSEAPVNVVP